jgi:hypothetical protein
MCAKSLEVLVLGLLFYGNGDGCNMWMCIDGGCRYMNMNE